MRKLCGTILTAAAALAVTVFAAATASADTTKMEPATNCWMRVSALETKGETVLPVVIRTGAEGLLLAERGAPPAYTIVVPEKASPSQRYAGCRWYASWHSVIPRIEKLSIPGDLDDTQVPAFVMREPDWYDIRENPEFAARLRVNKPDEKFAGFQKFGGVAVCWSRLNSCHTFQYLLPPAKYAKEHPEYFALVDGKRKTTPLWGPEAAEPCLTNPDVLRIVTSNVLAYIRQNPGYPIYGVSQNDNWDGYCHCDNCAKVDEEEGSHSGTVVRFVNAVAYNLRRVDA